MVLQSLGKSLSSAIERIISRGPIDKELIKELKNEILTALLDADIQFDLAYAVVNNVEARAMGEKLPPGLERKKAVINIVYEELTAIMGRKAYKLNLVKDRLNILMTVGIQGSGKTTTVGKLSKLLKKQGWHIGIVCADTWRPGAYHQLQQLGEKVGVDVFGLPDEKNAMKIAQKGVKQFNKEGKNLIIIDTAGRHKEEKTLIKEMQDLNKKLKPDEIILVIDGTLGQAAYSQATAFAQATPIGSIIVTKLDGTAKGGGAISAAAATRAPIKYIGTGEKLEDIEEFNPTSFVSRILGMGDLEALLEEVKRANISIDEDRTKAMMKGKMNYDDILQMFEAMNSMGGFRKILNMLPGGLSHQVDDNMLNMSKETMNKYRIVISSMTKAEKLGDVRLNKSRIERLAKGSGVSVETIKELIAQKKNAEKTIKQMTKPRRKGPGGDMGGMPFPLPLG